MTAMENVMVGRHVRTKATALGAILRTRATVAEERAIRQRSLELLEYVGVAKYADYQARTLAYGDQRRLEIARALATDPKLLALDEPAAGMNATEKLALRALLEAICRDGVTILLIEHDVKLVMGLCDQVTVLDYGKAIAVGTPARGAAQSGRHRSVSRCCSYERRDEGVGMTGVVLSVRGLKVAYGGIQAVKGIDLEVRAGELVTLIGANGAGKTTTLKAITGTQAWSGEVDYMGTSTKGQAPYQLLTKGLTMVPEGRGVFARMSVTENLQMGAFVRKDAAGIKRDIDQMFALFPRLKERAKQLAGTLSGGEQQMLAMARALMSEPKLLLLDEPSMGLAPILVEKVFEVIRSVAERKVPMLLVEQNARLALEVAHRGYVMESGLITLSGDAKSLLNDPKVREAYLGEAA